MIKKLSATQRHFFFVGTIKYTEDFTLHCFFRENIHWSVSCLCYTTQQECEELAQKVTDLTAINGTLRSELDELKKACEDMEAENAQLMVNLPLLNLFVIFCHEQ